MSANRVIRASNDTNDVYVQVATLTKRLNFVAAANNILLYIVYRLEKTAIFMMSRCS